MIHCFSSTARINQISTASNHKNLIIWPRGGNFNSAHHLLSAAMVFLSVTVVKGSKPLLPWQIIECHSGNISIQGFFETVLLPKLQLDEETGTIEVLKEQLLAMRTYLIASYS